jgi:hypothetical protein
MAKGECRGQGRGRLLQGAGARLDYVAVGAIFCGELAEAMAVESAAGALLGAWEIFCNKECAFDLCAGIFDIALAPGLAGGLGRGVRAGWGGDGRRWRGCAGKSASGGGKRTAVERDAGGACCGAFGAGQGRVPPFRITGRPVFTLCSQNRRGIFRTRRGIAIVGLFFRFFSFLKILPWDNMRIRPSCLGIISSRHSLDFSRLPRTECFDTASYVLADGLMSVSKTNAFFHSPTHSHSPMIRHKHPNDNHHGEKLLSCRILEN